MAIYNSNQRRPRPDIPRSTSYPTSQYGPVYPQQYSKGGSSTREKIVAVALCLLLLIVGVSVFKSVGSKVSPADDEIASAQPESKPEPEPPQSLDYTAMDTTIQGVIAANPGMDIGVATVDILTGDTKTYGVEVPFVAASTAKLLTAISFLHDVEQGKHSLQETVSGRTAEAALEALIVDSDNQTWHELNEAVMSHDELAAYARTIGFTNYDPDLNTVTPSSLATLLSNLYQKRLLNEEHTALLLSYMARAKEVDYIISTAPAGTKVYHKPGYLSDRMHDAAILDNGSRPYVLIIFTKSRTAVYDTVAGKAVFTQIAQATYDTFLH